VGALVDPDFERILSLKPELVFVCGTQTDLIARLERARVPVFRYEHAGLADVTTTIRAIGDRIQRTDASRVLTARIQRELDDVRKRVAGKPRPKTAIVFEREPGTLRGIFASAGVGFMHDLLELAGGADVFGDIRRQSVQASTELLLARAPDVIIEVYGEAQWSADRLKNELNVWAALQSIPAVRNKRVHILIDDRLAVPGPRVAEAARVLAGLIHP
jgi:iron complex transport system substrate-binding protein